ncbi:MAG TPA: SCP2 sterol-binding domain-containing protein [Steroidobacteraceae bacterium]|nr:SCP2 sterol-binding domain-containing protein [Steroidobacteraceae bacterium]
MLTATLGNLLNRGLPRSVRARQLVAQLAGHSVAIAIRDFARLRVTSDGQTLTVAGEDGAADATLSGGPLSLLALSGGAAQAVLQRGDVIVTGDTEIAGKFRELLSLLRPDPEEELSLVIGDVAAHRLGRVALLAGGWGRRAARVTLENLAEYLGHERRDLVPRNEGEQFLRGVEALREDADRLQARLELLERRRGTS